MGSTDTALVLTQEQKDSFERDGFLVVEGFASDEERAALRRRAEQILDEFDPKSVSIFSTKDQAERDINPFIGKMVEHGEQESKTDNYFLNSAANTSCFFEEKAFAPDGSLTQPKQLSINKIGHAMHDADAVFRAFSRSTRMAALLRQLGHAQPVPVQSMYIFKQPRIGGEVVPHQDSSFLYTEPPSVIGLWLALEDADRSNGCLWALPGSHRAGLRRRFTRDAAGAVTFDGPAPAEWDDLSGGVPLEVKAGTLVALHGALVHWSSENTSTVSRHAYTMHAVDGAAAWAPDNWLQRPPSMPFEPLPAA